MVRTTARRTSRRLIRTTRRAWTRTRLEGGLARHARGATAAELVLRISWSLLAGAFAALLAMASRTTDEPPVFRRFFKAADTSPLCDGVRPTSCNPSQFNEGNFAGDRSNRAHRLRASDEGPSSFVCGATFDVILASFWERTCRVQIFAIDRPCDSV